MVESVVFVFCLGFPLARLPEVINFMDIPLGFGTRGLVFSHRHIHTDVRTLVPQF